MIDFFKRHITDGAENMSRKIVSMFLIFLIAMSQLLHAQQTNESEGKARVKSHIEKHGIGRYQPVEVVLHNKKKWKGYISEVLDDSFVLVHKNTRKPSTFEYSQVKEINSTKLNPGQKFAKWSVITGAIVVLSWLVAASSQD